MMDGVAAMLRQVIAQLEQLQEGHRNPPSASDFLPRFQPRAPPTARWPIFDSEDSCHGMILTAEKSENQRMLKAGRPPKKKARKDRNQEARTVSRNTTEALDRDIWKELPEDLIEAVVSRLPIAAFVRFRLVCQKWNRVLLTSQSFSQKRQAQSWFYTAHEKQVPVASMYDPSEKRWYWHHPTPSELLSAKRRLPVASAGGLICFLDYVDKSFYICNPVTGSFKKLPPKPVFLRARMAVGMALNGESGYKILWLGSNGEYGVYDSTKNSWIRPGNVPGAINLPLNLRSQGVCISKTLYFMLMNPDGLLSFDMETGAWKQLAIPAPQHLTDRTLAECGGRIMLAGLLKKNAATCVCIWELQKMTLLWKEVDRMPNLWCLEFYGKHVKMACLGNRGVLLLSLRSRQMNRLVTYDMASREWAKVHAGKKKYVDCGCGIAFQPCLSALP